MTQGSGLSTSRIVALKPDGAEPPLFMFAGVRGGPDTFRELAAQLSPDRPVYGFYHIGAQDECEPVRQVARMAQLYAAELRGVQRKGPYYLLGYSFGGVVAFELARELIAQGERVAMVIIMDCPAPGYPRPAPLVTRLKAHIENLRTLHHEKRRDYVKQRFANVRTRFAKAAGLIPYIIPGEVVPELVRRIDAALYEAYRNYHPQPLSVEVLFLTADTPPEWPTAHFDDPLMGWGDLLRGRISQCAIPGTHLSVFAPQNLPVLAARIRSGLARSQRAECRADVTSAGALSAPAQVKSV
jgi:thioesterase domain-containing protein